MSDEAADEARESDGHEQGTLKFKRPPGAARKGCYWCTDTGKWIDEDGMSYEPGNQHKSKKQRA